MRVHAVLNRDGGTLKTTDIDAFSKLMKDSFSEAGHDIEIETVVGRQLVAALDKAAGGDAEVILIGGGDGTVSAAAARLMDTDKALAILPAGTMNLFARSLGIPLALDQAVKAFAKGKIRQVDIATANGRPFIHQFSIGMHAKLVQLRSKMDFGSRLGKIGASTRAALNTLMDPPRLDVTLFVGDAELQASTTGIGVSNNLFGEGHLPYADRPDGGTLGVYVTLARTRGETIRLAINLLLGRWRDNAQVDVHEGRNVRLVLRSRKRRLKSVIDGELSNLDPETEILIHPGSLKVLVPGDSAE